MIQRMPTSDRTTDEQRFLPVTYYLAWRSRPNLPWQSEEFSSRIDAHDRYFSLIERGVEAYLERRRRAA